MFYFGEAFLSDPMPVKDRDELMAIHDEHVRYVAKGAEQGVVIFGGPKAANGGVVLIKAPSLEDCQAFLAGDPMIKAGAQRYDITEFQIIEHNPCLDPLLD